jgi:hypothetical protein
MAHPIDHMLPEPKFPIGSDEHIDIFVQAVGRKGQPRGEHGFGMVIKKSGGDELGRFGYRSRNPETTSIRGYLGALLSALVWRDRHASANPVVIKTNLKYIYGDFRNYSEKWMKTGLTASKKPIENSVLVKAAYGHWKAQSPIVDLMGVSKNDLVTCTIAKDIAIAMRDHGGMEPLHKPGDPYEFEVIEEDIDDLINYAVDRDNRQEEREAAQGLMSSAPSKTP